MGMVSGPLACVHCGNADIQSVRSIYNAGTWSSTTQGYSVGTGHIAGSYQQGHYHPGQNVSMVSRTVSQQSGSTRLAAMLAPPARPCKECPLLTIFSAVVLAGSIGFAGCAVGTGHLQGRVAIG